MNGVEDANHVLLHESMYATQDVFQHVSNEANREQHNVEHDEAHVVPRRSFKLRIVNDGVVLAAILQFLSVMRFHVRNRIVNVAAITPQTPQSTKDGI